MIYTILLILFLISLILVFGAAFLIYARDLRDVLIIIIFGDEENDRKQN